MKIPFTRPDATGHWVDNPVKKKFLKDAKFRLFLREQLQKLLSTEIVLTLQRPPPPDRRYYKKLPDGYMIQVVGTPENKTETEQAMSDFIEKYFGTIQSKTFDDNKVKKWLQYPATKANHLESIRKIMNIKFQHIFTLCEEHANNSLKVYCLPKIPFSLFDIEEFDNLIQNEISQEMVSLPKHYKQSTQFDNELQQTAAKEGLSVTVVSLNSMTGSNQKEVILFGHYQAVNRLKEQLPILIEKHRLITFKLNSIDSHQIRFLLDTCSIGLKAIYENYRQFGIALELRQNEFSAPIYLKDKIESCITELLSHSISIVFESARLSIDIAEREEKHLKSIARKNHCYITTELIYETQSYPVSKALSASVQAPKSVVEQSNLFSSSLNVFKKIVTANGSIQLRTGDIALQKVDTIVISTTFNGLKEGVIERAGTFDYERTHTDVTGTKFTETNGGHLSCKRILFSNWVPYITTNDDALRKSIQTFILQSVKYATKDKDTSSIAFAVSDSCTNETILAQEIIAEAKRQLESRNLKLDISFILLPEQQNLRHQFFIVMETTQDIYAQFDWGFAKIKITLEASKVEYSTKCQEKINNYLKRCSMSTKVSNQNGTFQHWDQYTINAFYKYCEDKCVVPHTDKTKNEIELIGPVNCVDEVKQKLYLLGELAREKALSTQTARRPSSAANRSARLDHGLATEQPIVYNIMLSYCQKDMRSCQRLIDQLIEEGFSVWAEPVLAEQQRDALSEIDKSDCILICISEHYYEKRSCEKEAKYAFQTGKKVFPIKIRNHPLIGWQREIFYGKLFFQLFGSENHFNLEYEKLLLEIFQITKPGYVSLLHRKSGHIQQDNDELQSMCTVEQRRSMYEEKIRTLMEIGRIHEKEMKTLIEQLQNVIDDIAKDVEESMSVEQNQWKHRNKIQLSCCAKRWLRKATYLTKQNLPPFSVSGDINDAPFPIPEDLLEYRDQYSLFSRSSMARFRNLFETGISVRSTERLFLRVLLSPIPIDDEHTHGTCTQKLETFDGLSQVFHNRHLTVDSVPQKTRRLPIVPLEVSSTSGNEIQKRRGLDNPDRIKGVRKEIPKYSVKRYQRLTREELDVYRKKFAQRMEENAAEFEKFCSTDTAATRQSNKKERRQQS